MENSRTCLQATAVGVIPVSHSADDFQRFFVTNVETVRAATAESSGAVSTEVDHSQSSPSAMTVWWEVTQDEIRQIVLAAPPKSCSLDPLPTFILRECIDVLLPYLTTMVNVSLREGSLQSVRRKHS